MLILLWAKSPSSGFTAGSLKVLGKHSRAGVHPGTVIRMANAETEGWESFLVVTT